MPGPFRKSIFAVPFGCLVAIATHFVRFGGGHAFGGQRERGTGVAGDRLIDHDRADSPARISHRWVDDGYRHDRTLGVRVPRNDRQKLSEIPAEPFVECLRGLQEASEALAHAQEVEDYQSIGVRCREALLAFEAAMFYGSFFFETRTGAISDTWRCFCRLHHCRYA
jgi:hypothetical protein